MDKLFKRKDTVRPADPENPEKDRDSAEEQTEDQNLESKGDQYGTFDGDESQPANKSFAAKFLYGDEPIRKRIQQFFAEFIGLFIFVFIGSLSVLGNEELAGIAAAHGFTIGLLIMAIGHVSGGHLNPAVTVGLFAYQKISLIGALMYIGAQCSGAVLGAFAVRAVTNEAAYLKVAGGIVGFGTENSTYFQSFVSEVILTFVLVLTVFMTAVDRSDNVLAPLAIGLAVFVDILAGAKISGASMNPARSFGPAIAYAGFGSGNTTCKTACPPDPAAVWATHWLHWAGPLLGGVLASIIYRFIFADSKKEN